MSYFGTECSVSQTPTLSHTSRTRMMKKQLAVILLIGLLAWAYKALTPPSPTTCGSPGGPPITGPRIELRDGRYLAYKEHGVPKDKAQYKIVFIHCYDCNRHQASIATQVSPEVMKELGVYVLSFDRPGYGESDPDPKRTVKSLALDVEELADQLELGTKFYVVGFSMGGQAVWGVLKHIPHRLAGAALIAPVVNFWWHLFPASLSKEVFDKQLLQDRWTLSVSHYTPWLTYWWNTQKMFPASSVTVREPRAFSSDDNEILSRIYMEDQHQTQTRQQGDFETIHRDLMVGFGKWDFDPTEIKNPFPNNEGSVHLWQGNEDFIVPTALQRSIAERLPWIHYHEFAGVGHMIPYSTGKAEVMLRALLSSNPKLNEATCAVETENAS
ncbi:uncharacterized protein LOC119981023 isoform X1 [Tripterygium wilfordii]|uniref:uncharacterized protein LOC119981023 isoform X1 n=1 Tax=Tripterygium wilfordii TaxID=458696 RepID=UPI0018F83E43|nr:uncharacterized protein LOC119981023 isoform X1 [Tripterygium wilfordii]